MNRRGFLRAIASAPLAAYVAARLPKPVRGMAVRWVRHYSIDTTQMPHRMDILYGVAVIRPELKVRVHAD